MQQRPLQSHETRSKYHRELRAGDTVTVTSKFVYPDTGAKTFFVDQRFVRSDGTLVATLRSTTGLLDLSTRKLVDDPQRILGALAVPESARGERGSG
jgi:acyl-CoA thioester hydrolase